MWLNHHQKSSALLVAALAVQLACIFSAATTSPTIKLLRQPARKSPLPRTPSGLASKVDTNYDVPPSSRVISIATSMQERKSVIGNAPPRVNLPTRNEHLPLVTPQRRNGATGQNREPSVGNVRQSNSTPRKVTITNSQHRISGIPRASVERLKSALPHVRQEGPTSRVQNIPLLERPSNGFQNSQSMHDIHQSRLAQRYGNAEITTQSKTKSSLNTGALLIHTEPIQFKQPSTNTPVRHNAASLRLSPNVSQSSVPNLSTSVSTDTNSQNLPSSVMNHNKPHKIQSPVNENKIAITEATIPLTNIHFKIPISQAKTEPSMPPHPSHQKVLKTMSQPGIKVSESLEVSMAQISSRSRGTETMTPQNSYSSAVSRIQSPTPQNLPLLNGEHNPRVMLPVQTTTGKLTGEAVEAIKQQHSSTQGSNQNSGQRSAAFPRDLNKLPHTELGGREASRRVLGVTNFSEFSAIKPNVQQSLHPNRSSPVISSQRNQNFTTFSTSNIHLKSTLNSSSTMSQKNDSPRNIGQKSRVSSGLELLLPQSFEQKHTPTSKFETNFPKSISVNFSPSREHASGTMQNFPPPKSVSSSPKILMQATTLFSQENSRDNFNNIKEGEQINIGTENLNFPPDINEDPLNVAFANSAVPNYVLRAPMPVIKEKSLSRYSGTSSGLIANYFIMNPLGVSASEKSGNTQQANEDQIRNSTNDQEALEDEITLHDLHQDWKSEILSRYYSTIGVKNVAQQRRLPKTLNRNRMTSNRTLIEAAVLLNKRSNMTKNNESLPLHIKNTTDSLAMSSISTQKPPREISESYERFSRNATLSSPTELKSVVEITSTTVRYDEISLSSEMNVLASNDTELRSDLISLNPKNEEVSTANSNEQSSRSPIDSNSTVSTNFERNLKNISLDSTHNVFIPLSNNSLQSDDKLLAVEILPNLETITEIPPDTTLSYEQPTEGFNPEIVNGLSTIFSELKINKTGDSIDEENLDSLVHVEYITPSEAPISKKSHEETSQKVDSKSIPKAISSNHGNLIPKPRIKEPTRQVLINNTGVPIDGLRIKPNERRVVVTLVDKQGRKIVVPAVFTPTDPKQAANDANGLFALPVKENATISIITTPKPSVLNTADENKIKDSAAVKDEKPSESTTRRSLLDLILRSTNTPRVTTPRITTPKATTPRSTTLKTTTPATKKVTNVIDLIWESVTRTAAPSTTTATVTTTETPRVTNLIDLIWASATEATSSVKEVASTTIAATTTTEAPRVTNLIDLIWASATEATSLNEVASTTIAATTTEAPRVTNLIDLIWASATEATSLNEVASTTIAATTTEAPRVTNLIDLIWASVTETPSPKEVTSTTLATRAYTPGVTNLIDLIWASVTEDPYSPIEETKRPQSKEPIPESSSTDPLIPVLQDVIGKIDKRLNELQKEITNGNTSLAEELNLLAAQMIQGSDIISQVPVQSQKPRSYLAASVEQRRERRPMRIADVVQDTPLNPVLTRLREEVNRGAERVRKEVSHFAEDTAETLLKGVEDASERVSRITATSYRGALQTRDALVGLLGSALENMSVYVSKALQDSIQTAFGTARSVGDFIKGLNDNLVGGILRQGRAVRNLFSNTIEEIGQASDRTIEVVNRVVENNLKTILDEK
ncbi:hypothetical protein FHG87_002939 [Trinorchestia longiramus]|nr:hypothetical protein FHG87_002939 [Trinorchestia longiramus]